MTRMTHLDRSHDPDLQCWVPGAHGHPDFPVQNLPLGVFSRDNGEQRIGSAVGHAIVDLHALSVAGLLPDDVAEACRETDLNALFALPAASRGALRLRLSQLLTDQAAEAAVSSHVYDATACRMHLPARIGDYTDFYAGIHHAINVGKLFRPDNPLLPNYKYVPIGYHGRASSVRVSGTAVPRPHGQRKPAEQQRPDFGPSQRLDYELELGIWVGAGNALGKPVAIGDAREHVAGISLLNDWSARDLQAWEYQPLGPFLSKSFLTSVSPWVVTSEALAPFRIAQPPRPEGDPRPLAYLWDDGDQVDGAFNIDMDVHLRSQMMRSEGLDALHVSRGSSRHMYWTVAQMLAHHTSNGCNLSPGDLLGTGTLSSPDPSGYGSLLELSQGGTKPLTLPDGEQRTFLRDGDEVIFTAHAHADGFVSIGFGECRGTVTAPWNAVAP